ncbi:ATP-binding cassette domain-containing protein [Candidatus Entotheonella palauensis]|uniref:ATP-binding cassette domain-containing protein n=1 Tax=Candidatus Entotheonella palauensis TaxID=93172 RepID=UPI0015C462BB|nr:ATP-binding cassette domain-containing protein [Candidatus Entotheonella palauensis]
MSVQDLTVSFDGQGPTLHQLSISFPKQQITAVIGPSGSGKSTLLRCLNRLWEPPPTTVFLDHQDITALEEGAIVEVGTPAHLFSEGCRHLTQSFAQGQIGGRGGFMEGESMVVMYMLIGATAFASLTATYLTFCQLFTPFHQLKLPQ